MAAPAVSDRLKRGAAVVPTGEEPLKRWKRRKNSQGVAAIAALGPLRLPGSLATACPAQRLKLVHITKNAGTALEKWGAENGFRWGAKWAVFREARRQLVPPQEGLIQSEPWHIPPRFFKANPYSGWDMFAIVRNPYHRIISEFRCPWKGFEAPASKSLQRRARRDAATSVDLNAWVKKKLQGGAAEAPFKNGHCIPQHLYIFNADGIQCIPASHVLRFESISEGFPALLQRYGWAGRVSVPHNNGSEMRSYSIQDLTEESRRLIEEKYSEDFRLLGYQTVSAVTSTR